jgi:hypothetical protein
MYPCRKDLDALAISNYTRENIIFPGNSSVSCVNMTNTSLWGDLRFNSGSKIEVLLEFCD